MTKHTITGTPANWDEEVLRSAVPVMVDFWGAHCPPCEGIAPFLEEIAFDLHGRAKVVKVNAREHMELAMPYTWSRCRRSSSS
jgi:thioredoxin 1